MMRVMMFLGTNLAVMMVANIMMMLLGAAGFTAGPNAHMQSTFIMCAAMGFVGSFISLFMSKSMAKRSTRTEIIETPRNEEEQWLVDTVKELADKAGIDMPEVGIFPSQTSNAFATGWNKNKALVAVSTGLLQRFERHETKAVMAHEIGHVANGDMVTLSLIQGVVNTFVMFFARIIGQLVDSLLSGNSQNRGRYGFGYHATRMAAEFALGFLASAIVAWFSRRREFRADHAGATFAERQSMIAALQRLQAEHNPGQLPESMAAFGIRSNLSSGMRKLFSTHPPLDVRIAALKAG